MGAFQNFVDWLSGKKTGDYKIEAEPVAGTAETVEKILDIKMLMMASAAGYLAAGLSMCRWRTIKDGKEEKGAEFFRLNNRPNGNQSKAEFCARLVFWLAMQNEALVFSPNGKDLYVADSWNVERRGTQTDIYRNVSVDDDTRTYTFSAAEVMHIKMDWTGLSPLLSSIGDEYETMIGTAYGGYRRQSGTKGVLNIVGLESGTEAQRTALMNRLQAQLKTFFNSQNGALTLNTGYTYTPIATSARNTSEMNDIANMTDEFAERLGLALRVPVALMKGSVENTENARTDLVMFGIRPIAQAFEQEYNAKRLGEKEYTRGSRLFIDPLPIQLGDTGALPQFCERMTSCGQYSVDELRDLRGEPLLGTPEAQKHYITKNYGLLENPDEAAGQAADGAQGSKDNEIPEGGETT